MVTTVLDRFALLLSAPARAGANDALLARVAGGDEQAVAVLYDTHHAQVRAFARRLLNDAEAAEDLVHDVFIALPSAVRRYRGESAFSTFLLSIAAHRARRHLRSAARARRAFDRLASEPATAAALSADPEHAASQRQLAAALIRALDALPFDQRVAFVLCEVEERTSVEVAAILGIPEGTVRTRLHAARGRLRKALVEGGVR